MDLKLGAERSRVFGGLDRVHHVPVLDDLQAVHAEERLGGGVHRNPVARGDPQFLAHTPA